MTTWAHHLAVASVVARGASKDWAEAHVSNARFEEGELRYDLVQLAPIPCIRVTFHVDHEALTEDLT